VKKYNFIIFAVVFFFYPYFALAQSSDAGSSVITDAGVQETSAFQVIPNPPDVQLPQPLTGERDVGDAISPMHIGQHAPFTGMLFSIHATATFLTNIRNAQQQCQIEIDHQVATHHAQDQLLLDNSQIDLHASQSREVAVREETTKLNTALTAEVTRLERIAAAPHTLEIALWTAGGTIFGTGLTALLFWLFY